MYEGTPFVYSTLLGGGKTQIERGILSTVVSTSLGDVAVHTDIRLEEEEE